jgi:hypothetical protein
MTAMSAYADKYFGSVFFKGKWFRIYIQKSRSKTLVKLEFPFPMDIKKINTSPV